MGQHPGTVYPSTGQKRGTALHTVYPPIGESRGSGVHNPPVTSGGKNDGTALGTHYTRTGPPEPRNRKRKRGSKPPTKAMAGQPIIGQSGGSLGGQTMGKIG